MHNQNAWVQQIKDKMLKVSQETSESIKEFNAKLNYIPHCKKQKILKSKIGRDYVLISPLPLILIALKSKIR